jgi:hypothetical protein
MKNALLFFFLLTISIGFSQSQKSLSELLWERVDACYNNFEDMNDDGKPDFEKIDDSQNGYLKVWGGYPTCGCTCSSTVGAYKNSKGEFIFLQSDEFDCQWKKENSSNKSMEEIMPDNFGVNSFSSQNVNDNLKSPAFFIEFEIPRVGTDTKVKIELVPFGLKPSGSDPICYSYKQDPSLMNWTPINSIKDIAKGITSDKTLEFIIVGDFENIASEDEKVISKSIGLGFGKFKTKTDLQNTLKELRLAYDIYNQLDYNELILGWNRNESKFYIKDNGSKSSKQTFREFLIKNDYWSPKC